MPPTAAEPDLHVEVWDEIIDTLSGVLDIREVFSKLSAIVGHSLPHDRLTMTFHDSAGNLALQAASNSDGPSRMRARIDDPARLASGSFRVIDDLAKHWRELTDWRQQTLDAGYRSALVVHLSAGQQGFGLQFWSKTRSAFNATQVPIARRLAAHVGLAVSHEQLAETARRASAAQARAALLEARVERLSAELDSRTGFGRAIGESARWNEVVASAAQVAATETTVLLTGESGTGKEVIARFIHRASARRHGPFIAVNCAALPEQLLESELFGFERGAFTGAQAAKRGQIELAARGVLFLDEVGEMSPSAQAKFLRVLQEREFQRLGGTRLLHADVRVIAATNRDLRKAMERGDFREDLYYRLRVFDIRIPPLRDRPDDILPLTAAFLDDIARSFGRVVPGMTREAREALLAHRWPGNVRELRNVLERAVIVSEGGLIAPEHLSLHAETHPGVHGSTNLPHLERQAVEQALRDAKGNRSKAARLLGVSRKQLYVRLRRYGLG